MDNPQHDGLVDMATTALANKPWLGVGAAGGSGALGVMDVLTPYLEFSTLLFGFCIGLITLIGVTKKYFTEKK